MYLSKKNHIIADTLAGGAIINLCSAVLSGACRFLMTRLDSAEPAMMEQRYFAVSIGVSVLQILACAILFLFSARHLSKARHSVPIEDYTELAKLQEEYLGKDHSALSSYSVKQLLQLWAAILIGVQIIYDVTSVLYRNVIETVMESLTAADANEVFISVYNSSHGFKYVSMMIALLIGVFATGVFLRDKALRITTGIVSVVFVFAFAFVEQQTVTLFTKSIGIVWTSVIFHLMETVGLLALSLYLRKKYIGT